MIIKRKIFYVTPKYKKDFDMKTQNKPTSLLPQV